MWVFRMVDTSLTPSLGYMQLVPDRTAATLLPIIQAHRVQPCNLMNGAYNAVAGLPAVAAHHTVNHSICFVDPATGVHTQHIESYQNRAKLKLKRMKGCHSEQLPSYLNEFMWRERYRKSSKEAWDNIIQDIAQQYPV